VKPGDIFGVLFGPTTAPETSIFVRFQTEWPTINTEIVDAPLYGSEALDINNFNIIPEYRQMKRNALQFLHNFDSICCWPETTKPLSFKAPGAASTARWLAKILYSMKIESFRTQFLLTPAEA
jgi:hypothetical protein